MPNWKKLGKIFDPTQVSGIPWMKEYAQSPAAVVFDQHVRVYFACRPEKDSSGQYVSYLAYVDLNRSNLFDVLKVAREPILRLGDLGTFDEFGTNPASAIFFDNQVRIYYCGWTRCESVPFNSSIGMAYSHDMGETFTKIGKGPVISFTPNEPFLLGSPRIKRFNNTWYLWYAAGSRWIEDDGRPEPVYRIKMAQSTDGISWAKADVNLIPTVLEKNECQASPEVFFANDRYHMYFSYRYSLGYRSKQHGYRIGYATSFDLKTWTRDDSRAGIGLSETGWDSEMISYPNIFCLDDEVFMLYQGNSFGRYGFGLAKLVEP